MKVWIFVLLSVLFAAEAYGGGCSAGKSTTGMVILDNTANPGAKAISLNLSLYKGGGSKGCTAIETGTGVNSINIADYHTLARDTAPDPDNLVLFIGKDTSNVDENLLNTTNELKYFSAGGHLFELNRLRTTADWLSQDSDGNNQPDNITPDSGVPYGTYGTLTFEQFLDNIAQGRTMYGMVRVLVPLEKGNRADCKANCNLNSLGQTVDPATIYGFCSSGTGLCSCAPDSKFKIQEGRTVSGGSCSFYMPPTAKIKVKGSLLWDFVDNNTGDPIPLSQLPYAPRELYFKVEIPIMVNWAHDADDDGAMDNMFAIKAVSNGKAAGVLAAPTINFSDIPQVSKDAYQYYMGKTLDSTEFASLDNPTKYHLLMPSGYPDGWADAFDKLNIDAATWHTLPPDGCTLDDNVTPCSKFGVPNGITGVMAANDVRSSGFEDIPVYLYSGGLIDMHDHVNISGLVYVPQGMELEAKDSNAPTQQFIMGAVVVRDTFYIEAKDNTITVLSADPLSFSTAQVTQGASQGQQGSSPLTTATTDNNTSSGGSGSGSGNNNGGGNTNPCYGCGGGGNGAGGTPVSTRWMEIRP